MSFEKGKRGSPATEFRSGKEAAEMGRKGGIESGIARRVQKIGQSIGMAKPTEAEMELLAKKYGLPKEQISNFAAMFRVQLAEAMTGDTAAFTAFLKGCGAWVEKNEHTGADGEPLLGNMSKEEALRYLADMEDGA